GDVRAGRIETGFERLHKRRPRPRERIEHMLSRSEVAAEERLHELRDELPEVRVQPVNVLRPFPLGEVALGPGKVEVEIAVERVLCRSHGLAVFGGHDTTPGPTGEDRRR